MLKITLKKDNLDKEIKLPMITTEKQYSKEEIKNFIELEQENFINFDKDVETIRFKCIENMTFRFYFSNRDIEDEIFNNTFAALNFTEDDVLFESKKFKKSFYLFEIYSSKNIEDQIFFGQTYMSMTKERIHIGSINPGEFVIENFTLNIQEDILYLQTFNELYLKVFFYNPITGKLMSFKKSPTSGDFYWHLTINKTNYNFEFNDITYFYEDWNLYNEQNSFSNENIEIPFNDITENSNKILNIYGNLVEQPDIIDNPNYEP